MPQNFFFKPKILKKKKKNYVKKPYGCQIHFGSKMLFCYIGVLHYQFNNKSFLHLGFISK